MMQLLFLFVGVACKAAHKFKKNSYPLVNGIAVLCY